MSASKLAWLDLPPFTHAAGRVQLPGSKSISNRVLLLAALCDGATVLTGLLDSDDTQVMIDALRVLGCDVQRPWQGRADAVRIQGVGGRLAQATSHAPADLFLGNAGTAMRPLTAALALAGARATVRGVPRMHERPIGDLVDALQAVGCGVTYLGQSGYPPLAIAPSTLALDAPIAVRGDVSSQFLTALLLALPMASMGRSQPIVVDVLGELISKPYVDITLKLLARFGVQVQRQGWQRFVIAPDSRYTSPGTLPVEADASSASYFVALGALCAPDAANPPSNSEGPGLRIDGVGEDSIQGDIRFVDAARAMGAVVHSAADHLRVQRGAWPLKAIDLDCNHIPDAAMTLAVMALYADGPSTLRNIASWRVKETDRIHAMATELRKLGAGVDEGPDWLRITPPASPAHWRAAAIHTYDDHRVAMCFSLAALNPAGLPVRILDPACVAKTFPTYFDALFSVTQPAAADIPVITIDGPSASGKGTLAAELAQKLGYHFLDSGSLYRAAALAAGQQGVPIDTAHEAQLGAMAAALPIRFSHQRTWLADQDVTEALRTEATGADASRISALPAVRQGLLQLQHAFRRAPGLVADGRDMGTVIFPEAALKVFLTASAQTRAERRHKQLISKGISAKLEGLMQDLTERDARDASRQAAPLKPAQDALMLDNSTQSVDESITWVMQQWQRVRPF